jgi:hypothetical protein
MVGIAIYGLGGGAVWSLVRLPQVSDCNRLVQPFASASLRLYCAQVAAGEQTREGLLKAINLVDDLPKDHPLRATADRYIQHWAFDLIVLAEAQYNEGDLAAALATLKDIPLDRLPCEADACPRDEILAWRDGWKKAWDGAEKIYQDAEQALLDQDWDKAAAIATQLLSVNNKYWQVTKYNELSAKIRDVRDTNGFIARAKATADRGGADNLLKAIEIASQVQPSSSLYTVAQAQIVKFGRQMLEEAERVLEDYQDLSQALAIAQKIPPSTGLKEEVQDFTLLAKSQAKSWSGRIPDLEAAIAQAQAIESDRPLYTRSRQLIQQWQQEIQDLGHLERATTLAQGGRISDLMTAIAEVSLIPSHHPRYGEADRLISQWNKDIQILEDQPFFDRATELAQGQTVGAYQAAIAEMGRIDPDRALYNEAQNQINAWQQEIQRLEDSPYLDVAQQYADAGQYPQAIAEAQRITPDSPLYSQAQGSISEWRVEIQGVTSLQDARNLGTNRNPDGLAAAIRTADRVPESAPQRSEAEAEIERWSQELLQIAVERSGYDLVGAIQVAQQVPPGTTAYTEAQAYIQSWQASQDP